MNECARRACIARAIIVKMPWRYWLATAHHFRMSSHPQRTTLASLRVVPSCGASGKESITQTPCYASNVLNSVFRSNLIFRTRSQPCTIRYLGRVAIPFCCVSSRPYRFFNVTRCLANCQNYIALVSGRATYLEYLSSGENRAGCADFVTSASTTFFNVYVRLPSASRVNMRCMAANS